MSKVRIKTGYEPRTLQAEIHKKLKRYNVLVCHRRFGKTVLCVNELLDNALRCDKPMPRFGYLAPTFKQAKDIAWGYCRQYTHDIPGVQHYENTAEIRFAHNGAVLRVYGVGDDPDALRGLYWDGIVLDEYAKMPARVWTEVIRPGLIDRDGWAIFIGTPMGRNAFCEYYEAATMGWPDDDGERKMDPEWWGAMYKASETGVLSSEALISAKRQMPDDEYEQEFECSFEAAIMGAFYGSFMREVLEDGRITKVSHMPELKVDTWWDLGHSDATAIWFVQHGFNEIRVIDYYENHLQPLEHYAHVLQQKALEGKYIYGRHIWPHDGGSRTLASKGRPLSAMMSDLGFGVEVQPRQDIMVGINRVRQLLSRCWFDATKCADGIEALRAYRKEEDESRGMVNRKYFKPTPLHDWSSHGSDAFRTGALAIYDSNTSRINPRRDRYAPRGDVPISHWAS